MQRFTCVPLYLRHSYAFLSVREHSTSSPACNRTALITGAGRGIGRAIALHLASDGFDICINDLESNAANARAVEAKALGRSFAIALGDVTDMSEVKNMIQTPVKTLGLLNVVVANAVIVQIKPLAETTENDMQHVFEANVFGLMNRQFIGASKAAVRSLTQGFALEYGKHGITIDAEMSKYNSLEKGGNFRATEQLITLGRTSVPEDVSNLVSFLASPDSDYVTGQTILVDGESL
ncbi:acetoin reductase [Moniliophthora roreri MCA 2997]|uniref:Acetoin reductase n=1 Tax=Moniliophthora roreri (strain MCA 2997) TaxID=1381753 RepID=V2WVJ0_MONRO|nr:acetoin reductase [Moniliophthora roreri MCA 2997]